MKVRGYANFALIKYWGKIDEELKLPFYSSLSFTVDKLYSEVILKYDETLDKDIIIINGKRDLEKEKRVIKHMDFIRKKYNIKSYAIIESKNNFPTKAGLASSASAFAALSYAAIKAADINIDNKEISKIARVGSGSASRSIYGGFVIWNKGNDENSFAEPLNIKWDEFRIIVCLLEKHEKEFSSTFAMKKSVEKKKSYSNWVKQCEIDLENILVALAKKDIEQVGIIAENNAEKLHELIESTGIKYKNEKTLNVINKIKDMRKNGIKAYYTIDAGPNIKIITLKSEVNKIIEELKDVETIVCQRGSGILIKN